MTHEDFLYQKYKAEQKWKQSTEYKIMTTPQSDAASRLPVYTPLYYGQWDIKSRAMRLDQDFNCHSFIIKKNLVTKKYIGGWKNYKHGGGSVKYFKFKDKTHSWILPVYEGSYTAQHPVESFPWNKDIIFVGEVTEAEYNKQFKEQQAEQLELF